MTSVGYPGPAGSHSAAASLLLAPDSTQEPLASFIAVAEAAVAGEVTMGVLPIENSLHGPVAETHDLLYEAPLSIVSEVTLPIVHQLIAKAPIQVSEVKTLRSNSGRVRPVPRARARARRALPAVGDDRRCRARGRRVRRSDRGRDRERRGGGAVRPARDRDGRRRSRGVHALRRDRAVHARRPRAALAHGVSFVTDHQPGSLYHALGPFHKHGLNLVQLVSRPIPKSTFRYRFDMVLDGHPLDAELQTALAEMREWTREVRIFGSYAATGDH